MAFAYDENHNRTVMTDTLGVTRWVYDPLNRVVAVTDSLGRALGYAYDAVGNRIAITYPVTGTVTYAYDANNRLRGVTDPYGHTTRYERDGVGNLIHQLNPNGTVTEAAYDRANRLVGLTTRRPDGAVIAAFAYDVNEVGLRTGMTATYGWRNPPVVVERYTYDPLRRLTGVTDSEGFREIYEYDAAGNRTRWWANDDRTTRGPGTALRSPTPTTLPTACLRRCAWGRSPTTARPTSTPTTPTATGSTSTGRARRGRTPREWTILTTGRTGSSPPRPTRSTIGATGWTGRSPASSTTAWAAGWRRNTTPTMAGVGSSGPNTCWTAWTRWPNTRCGTASGVGAQRCCAPGAVPNPSARRRCFWRCATSRRAPRARPTGFIWTAAAVWRG